MRGVGNDRCDHVAGVLSSTPDLGLASLAKRDRMAKSVMMFANSRSTNRECHLPFRHGSRGRSRRRILRLPVSAPIESTSTLNLHSAWPGHVARLRGALQASASGYGRAISQKVLNCFELRLTKITLIISLLLLRLDRHPILPTDCLNVTKTEAIAS